MSLRARLALVGALAVAVTVIAISVLDYFVVEDRLRNEVDTTVLSSAARIADVPAPELALPFFKAQYAGPPLYVQIVSADGKTSVPDTQRLPLPVSRADRRIAAGTRKPLLRDAHVRGKHLRIATVPAAGNKAVQLARSVSDVDSTLDDLRVTLTIVAAAAVVAAAAIGLFIARAALRPVRRLTRAAEHVAQTQDLSHSIDVRSRDELGRLAASINAMLAALDASREQQRQLVGDASHELRTPLTSLRTNLEVLGSRPEIDGDDRARLLGDVITQLEELTVLVDDLVELASDDSRATEEFTDVDLDRVLQTTVDRARLRAPDVDIELAPPPPTRLLGQRQHLERALVNILDNACKWSPPGGTVEVELDGGVVTVRDHGPGIDRGDLPHVFDRFYRAPAARALPGSGLGLAIVRRVVDAHGGSVTLDLAPGGGTVAVVTLPVEQPAPTLDPEPVP